MLLRFYIFFPLILFHHLLKPASLELKNISRLFYLNFRQMVEGKEQGFLRELQSEMEELVHSDLISALKTFTF